MKVKTVDLGREKIVETLTRYIDIADELYSLAQKFEEATGSDRKIVKETLTEKYKAIKSELEHYHKQFSLVSVKPIGDTASFFAPAVSDIYPKISGVRTNMISINSLRKFRSAVYDIQDYSRYWLGQMK